MTSTRRFGFGYNKSGTVDDVSHPFDTYDWWLKPANAATSESEGVPFIDEVPLIGAADKFEQPTAAYRLEFVPAGLDGHPTMKASVLGQRMYRQAVVSAFEENSGTVAMLVKIVSGYILFAEIDVSINYEILKNGTNLNIYTQMDGFKDLGPFLANTWQVLTFTMGTNEIDETVLKTYVNGVLQSAVVINKIMVSNQTTLFNFKTVEEGSAGQMGDVVRTADCKTAEQVAENYMWFKQKYPSLP